MTEQYERSGVVTTVEWIPRKNLSYNVSVYPELPLLFTGDASVRLVIPYSTQVEVNVSAMLCGWQSTTMKMFFHRM